MTRSTKLDNDNTTTEEFNVYWQLNPKIDAIFFYLAV